VATGDYVTLSALKTTLNITGTNYDTDLQSAITAASRAIDQLGGPGRRFYQDASPVARQFWPENNGYCIIDDLSVYSSLTANSATWVKDTDFYLEPINASVDGEPWTAIRAFGKPFIYTKAEVAPGSWVGYDGRITVTGQWGWASTPQPIVQACGILASRLFKRAREAPFGIVGMGVDVQAIRLGNADPDVLSLVEPYSRGGIIA
jgi:hypothetical protein